MAHAGITERGTLPAEELHWQHVIDWQARSRRVGPRPKGVLGGLVVIAIGVPFLLQAQGVPHAPSYLFVALGLAFLASYIRGGRNYAYLVPGTTLASFGIALLIPTWLTVPQDSLTAVFLVSIAAGLASVVAIEPVRRWPLIPAAMLVAIAMGDRLWSISVVPAAAQAHIVPIVLLGVGAYLLIERQG